jgi:hypothetical protein
MKWPIKEAMQWHVIFMAACNMKGHMAFVCVCRYICMHVCVYVYVYIYICMYKTILFQTRAQ